MKKALLTVGFVVSALSVAHLIDASNHPSLASTPAVRWPTADSHGRPVHLVPSGTMENAVGAYYEAVASKNLAAAYASLSPAAQARHPYADFISYQNDVAKTDYQVLPATASGVPVYVAERRTDDPTDEERLSGTWRVVASADGRRWLLDRGEFLPPVRVALVRSAPTSAPLAQTPQTNLQPPEQPAGALAEKVQLATESEPATFEGFLCKEATCRGHRAGYAWAEQRAIDDPNTCYSGPRLSNPAMVSFSEGCEAFVDDSTGADRLALDARYTQ